MCYKFLIKKIRSQRSMESIKSESRMDADDKPRRKSKSSDKDKSKSKDKSSSKDKDKSKSKEKPSKDDGILKSKEKSLKDKESSKSKEKQTSKDEGILKSKEKSSKDEEKKKTKLRRKSSLKDRTVENKSEKVDLELPKVKKPVVKVNNFDDVPISGLKGAAKKSWWEMDGSVPDEYTNVPHVNDPIEATPINKVDKPSVRIGSSVEIHSKTQNLGNVVKFGTYIRQDKPSHNDEEKDEETLKRGRTLKGLISRNQDLNDTAISNTSYRTANSNMSSFSGELNHEPIAKAPPFQFGVSSHKSEPQNNSGFGTGFKEYLSPSESKVEEHKKQEQKEDDTAEPNEEPQRNNISPMPTGNTRPTEPKFDERPEDDNDEVNEAPQTTDNSPRPSLDTPIKPKFDERPEDDNESQPISRPSRPTVIPPREPARSGPGSAARSKFAIPVPVKRGGGPMHARAAPVPKTPEDLIKDLMQKISKLEEKKYNEHTKLQKEFVQAILKNPEVLASLEDDLVIKTAKKISEVAGTNRTNLSRSSLICLGIMFEQAPLTLGALITDTITLCCKKGVSSSPELLIVASNFCLAKICLYSNECKVIQQLVSSYRSNKSYQIMTLNALVVMMDRLGPDVLKLKYIVGIVDVAVKGIASGGVPARTAGRNILGMLKEYSKLDQHLHACKATEIDIKIVKASVLKYDENDKNEFVDKYCKDLEL
uniref:Uncharacterized protein n=1 Tax=Theileria annulata TaxID=5874 RepID=A0A3B0MMG8_THEAN